MIKDSIVLVIMHNQVAGIQKLLDACEGGDAKKMKRGETQQLGKDPRLEEKMGSAKFLGMGINKKLSGMVMLDI